MPIIDVEQQTDAWLRLRIGRVTASEVWRLLKRRKRGEGELAEKRNYRNELVVERLTRRAVDTYVTPEMLHGIEQQPFAQEAYENYADCMVSPVGLAIHDSINGFAASPDGFIGDSGGVEYKCYTTEKHLQILMTKEVPFDAQCQMLAGMACTGKDYWDFVSFDPRLIREDLRIFVHRFDRGHKVNGIDIAEMEIAVGGFLSEVDSICMSLGVAWVFDDEAAPNERQPVSQEAM